MIRSAYIHIPFCTHICTYCDFTKVYYQKDWISKYLKSLKKEIVANYQNEVLDTIYIGGGTPSALTVSELQELFETLKILKRSNSLEYTIECNLENLTEEKLDLFKKYGINRLSIGVQTFQNRLLKFLGRETCDIKIISYAKKIGFQNINVDLIYALPNQTIEDLKDDLEKFLKLEITHISTYSLMIEPHTILYNRKVNPIDQDLDYQMYQTICKTLKEHGYEHYEISNFSKPGFESKHNLTYWNNFEYYGFGVGASGYTNRVRYTNTKSITKYLNGTFEREKELITKQDQMVYEMILGLRKLKGVSCKDFYQKYGQTIEKTFHLGKLRNQHQVKSDGNFIWIPEDLLYVSNDILVEFVGE